MSRLRVVLSDPSTSTTRRGSSIARRLATAAVLAVVAAGCSGTSGDSSTPADSRAARTPATRGSAPTSDATPLPALPAAADASLVVIGDATSNENDEWVNVMARQMSRRQHVRVQRIDQDESTRYLDPIDFGDGKDTLDIWNDSTNEPKALDADSAATVLPPSTTTVLISRGRGAEASSIAGDLDRTLATIRATRPKASVAVILQPDDGESSEALGTVAGWAAGKHLPVIDVAGAFARTNDQGALLDGDGQPTESGRALWAEVVAAELSAR